jgi:hypothetical protein
MTVDGVGYPLPKQELRIAAIDGGVLPTPATVDTGSMFNRSASEGAALRPTLGAMARFNLWPTPNVPNGGRSVAHAEQIGGTFYHKGKKVQLGLESAVRLWPTPHGFSPDGKSNGPSGNELGRAVNWATPHANCSTGPGSQGREGGENLQTQVGGSLNPTWVEWLMGWPLGWTDLEPLETAKFRLWCEQHGHY